MEIYTEIIGNLNLDSEWKRRMEDVEEESLFLDQWTAQKSRFLVKGDKNNEYPVALKRHTQILDGDILWYSSEEKRAAVFRLDLSPVFVIEMDSLKKMDEEIRMRTIFELGHAIGNQHWPAVVKGANVYVPLMVDKTVMLSVMNTHHIEGLSYRFQPGTEVIPYLAPHEIRRLFGGVGQEIHSHEHKDYHTK